MIVILYGKSAAAFVEPVVADLRAAVARRGGDAVALSIEAAVRAPRTWNAVRALYVLPFDVPLGLDDALPLAPAELVRALFPRAEIVNPLGVHELCWDKLAAARRLIDRGVPMPESLITGDPDEARAFVRRHGQAILKEPRSCGGQGHVVLLAGDDGGLAGEMPGRRYAIELAPSGIGRALEHGVLSCPPPFYLQRLVTAIGRGGVLRPAQILRAYVVDGQIVFWTERYRDRIRRPADFIISATFGARYRFLRTASEQVQTVARRAAEAVGMRIGAVDLVRGDEGAYVLEVDTDGQHMLLDRSFKLLPEYRELYDFDRYVGELIASPPAEPRVAVQRVEPRLPRPRPAPAARKRPRAPRGRPPR
jgi:glutathione synthase/RimK-type ligase-like ATP-grasp enzyme